MPVLALQCVAAGDSGQTGGVDSNHLLSGVKDIRNGTQDEGQPQQGLVEDWLSSIVQIQTEFF